MARGKEYIKKMNEYINSVLTGEREAGRLEIKTVERHVNDLKYAMEKGIFWDERAAMKALEFFSLLRHYKGKWAGAEFVLEGWQCFVVASIFGWKKAGGVRRFNVGYLEVSRKNGKTQLAAAIGLIMLLADGEFGAEVYSAAVDKDQASICWSAAGAMIQQSPVLRKRTLVSKKSIVVENTMSVFKAFSRDTNNKDGFNPSCGICDEVHAWTTFDIYDVIESGMGARTQPLIFMTTTAGLNLSLPCYDKRRVYIEILDGIKEQDDTFILIFSLDEKDDWKNSETWTKACPNLGVSVNMDYMERRLKAAMNDPSKEVEFKTKNLNLWVDAPTVWISDEIIMGNNHGTLDDVLLGEECYGGLDLASTGDINALALFFPGLSHNPVKMFFWIPEAKMIEKEDKVNYRVWVDQGYITTTLGNIIDTEFLKEDIELILRRYDVKNLSYDPFLAANGVIQHLGDRGYYDVMDELPQRITTLSQPTKELQRMLLSRSMDLMNNPVLRWMFRNVFIYTDPNLNIRIDKKRSSEKVDGCAALVNAVAGYMSRTLADKSSQMYKSHGLRTIKL
ncbi:MULTISPECIES: terminase large subunit [Butyricimonas]|uniref:terminase large subunit n=1 Tax=Butyricimonas TaxID=574697 RepID=UPI0022E542E5|nr:MULTISPECIES: terminase TerL endonuclease subunit [Butyricimonas]